MNWTEGEELCWSESDAADLLKTRGLVLADLSSTEVQVSAGEQQRATMRELHENHELDELIRQLEKAGFNFEDWSLVHEEAVTGERLATRFAWVIDPGTDKEVSLDVPNIPAILDELRNVGRRNIELKRFKGLGEMNPEELWDTTMDPSTRTILKVTMNEASKADDLFSTLMGEDVEIRRTYIEDHALDVKNIDV